MSEQQGVDTDLLRLYAERGDANPFEVVEHRNGTKTWWGEDSNGMLAFFVSCNGVVPYVTTDVFWSLTAEAE